VLECLPDELNAMSSNSSITKKNFFFFFFWESICILWERVAIKN
jgi:hypothetical protein